LKRRDRQSSCFDRRSTLALPLRRSSGPPGLRRLRFPFFYALVKEQDPRSATPSLGSAFAAPLRRVETLNLDKYPGMSRVKQEICCPLAAHQYSGARELGK
jgi:hypothetical protein